VFTEGHTARPVDKTVFVAGDLNATQAGSMPERELHQPELVA
jgi:hypothetical protein